MTAENMETGPFHPELLGGFPALECLRSYQDAIEEYEDNESNRNQENHDEEGA